MEGRKQSIGLKRQQKLNMPAFSYNKGIHLRVFERGKKKCQ